MKKLRVGVIGVGYLGKFHAEKYAQMDNIELVGVVDTDILQAKKIATKFCANAYQNHKDILNKVDAVSIVVPTPYHFAVGMDCLENGVDILIEKPITTTLAEADKLIQCAKSNNLVIQVGHLERFNPSIVFLQNIIKNPKFIESHRLSVYKDRCTDVSVVLDLMIHDIDIILNFVKSDIKSIHASGAPVISDHIDIANARVEFMGGCVANITASRISAKNERKIRIFQKDGYISVDFANHEIIVIKKNGQASNCLIPGMKLDRYSFDKSDALKDEIISFVKSVNNRSVPEVTAQMGRNALKTALDIMKQIKIQADRCEM